jgi:hypothetical protein
MPATISKESLERARASLQHGIIPPDERRNHASLQNFLGPEQSPDVQARLTHQFEEFHPQRFHSGVRPHSRNVPRKFLHVNCLKYV